MSKEQRVCKEGVIIPGMSMPQSCRECDVLINCDECEGWECVCPFLGRIGYWAELLTDRRRDDCPLQPQTIVDKTAKKGEVEQDMKKCAILSDDEYTTLVSLLNDAEMYIRQNGEYYQECAFDSITQAKNILKERGSDHA